MTEDVVDKREPRDTVSGQDRTSRPGIERLQRREAKTERPAVDTDRIKRQLANLRDLFLLADITREEYVGRKRALEASLNGGLPQPTYGEAVLVRAARLLADLGNLWAKATPTERAEIAGSLFAEVRVRDAQIVGAKLARDEYLPLVASATALALPQVVMARPEGSGRTPPTIVIEGVEELVKALRAA